MAARKKESTALVVRPPVREIDDINPELEEELDRVAEWQKVWELKWAGVSFRQISAQLGISKSVAHKRYHLYRSYRGVSPKVEDEREHQLTGLAELEAKLIREATMDTGTSWTAVAVALRGIYADRRAILGFDAALPAGSLPSAAERPQSVERALSVVRDLRGAERETA